MVTKIPRLKKYGPLTEISEESEMHKTVEDSIEKSIKKFLPSILDTLRKELRSTINKIVEKKIKNQEIKSSGKLLFESEKANLKTLLESYNRPENVKILGLKTNNLKSYEENLSIVINLAVCRS